MEFDDLGILVDFVGIGVRNQFSVKVPHGGFFFVVLE